VIRVGWVRRSQLLVPREDPASIDDDERRLWVDTVTRSKLVPCTIWAKATSHLRMLRSSGGGIQPITGDWHRVDGSAAPHEANDREDDGAGAWDDPGWDDHGGDDCANRRPVTDVSPPTPRGDEEQSGHLCEPDRGVGEGVIGNVGNGTAVRSTCS